MSNLNTSVATEVSGGLNEILFSHMGTPDPSKKRNVNLPFLQVVSPVARQSINATRRLN
jgi:hypothetical protein